MFKKIINIILSFFMGLVVLLVMLWVALTSIYLLGTAAEAARDYFGASVMVTSLGYFLGAMFSVGAYWIGKDIIGDIYEK